MNDIEFKNIRITISRLKGYSHPLIRVFTKPESGEKKEIYQVSYNTMNDFEMANSYANLLQEQMPGHEVLLELFIVPNNDYERWSKETSKRSDIVWKRIKWEVRAEKLIKWLIK